MTAHTFVEVGQCVFVLALGDGYRSTESHYISTAHTHTTFNKGFSMKTRHTHITHFSWDLKMVSLGSKSVR